MVVCVDSLGLHGIQGATGCRWSATSAAGCPPLTWWGSPTPR